METLLFLRVPRITESGFECIREGQDYKCSFLSPWSPVPVEYLRLARLAPVLNLPFGSVEAEAALKVT
jgi:hypothetical protein